MRLEPRRTFRLSWALVKRPRFFTNKSRDLSLGTDTPYKIDGLLLSLPIGLEIEPHTIKFDNKEGLHCDFSTILGFPHISVCFSFPSLAIWYQSKVTMKP